MINSGGKEQFAHHKESADLQKYYEDAMEIK